MPPTPGCQGGGGWDERSPSAPARILGWLCWLLLPKVSLGGLRQSPAGTHGEARGHTVKTDGWTGRVLAFIPPPPPLLLLLLSPGSENIRAQAPVLLLLALPVAPLVDVRQLLRHRVLLPLEPQRFVGIVGCP